MASQIEILKNEMIEMGLTFRSLAVAKMAHKEIENGSQALEIIESFFEQDFLIEGKYHMPKFSTPKTPKTTHSKPRRLRSQAPYLMGKAAAKRERRMSASTV